MLSFTINTVVLLWYISSIVYSFENNFRCATSDEAIIGNFSSCQDRGCSQEKRYSGDSYFECSIGMFQEWEEFKTTHNVLESYEQSNTKEMNPPSISAVGFYLIADRNKIKNNPNLNLTFRLPGNSSYDTKALLVKFVGMNDPRYPELIDPYYKDNPRYRLFNFPLYKTPERDNIHPREIVYNCLMGLDCQREKRVYLITLTAYTMNPFHPGSSITYHFTVYTTRDFTQSGKVTVAMAYIYQSRTMHVVFEPIAAVYVSADTYYAVKLMEIKTRKLQTVQIGHHTGRYEHEFTDVTKGSYIAEVIVQNCTGLKPCPVSQSGIVEVRYQRIVETALRTSTEESSIAGIYAVIGVVCGVVLLLVLLACFMVSIDHRPKVYILNWCEEKIHTDVSMALKQCIQKFFDTTVVSTATSNSVNDLSNKSGFQNHHTVIIATKCHHVPIEFVENTKRTLKRTKNISFLCFSQTDLAKVPDIDKAFMWSQINGCTEMLKYIQGKQKRHCLSILKQIRPHQKHVSENSEEVKQLRRTIRIASALPVQTPPNSPCPIHWYRPDDIQQPLLSNNCHVHPNMYYESEPYTQSFNAPPSPDYFDKQIPNRSHLSSLAINHDPVEEDHFEPRPGNRHEENTSPMTSLDMERFSREMMRINGGLF